MIEDDHLALYAAVSDCAGLCTIVGVEGSFSRRLGSQLAIRPGNRMVGSLADGCLEHQLASDITQLREATVQRYGRGSRLIDFKLPCGGGIDILLDPRPDTDVCRDAIIRLEQREPAALVLPKNAFLSARQYQPRLNLRIFGEGPEQSDLEALATAAGIDCECFTPSKLSLGREPAISLPDRWTATVLLFHDHEWETAILVHALAGRSFYIGAQGGTIARQHRREKLVALGMVDEQIDQIRAPIGLTPSSRTPKALAASILADVLAEYEALHPHA